MADDQQEPTWGQLLGADDWRGLIDPLNLSLRKLILRCGDLCQVTYDSFNSDTNSPYCGSSRYGKPSIFRKVAFSEPDLFPDGAAFFLYATSVIAIPEDLLLRTSTADHPAAWDRQSNWMGYVAAATPCPDRLVIYVAWRGTIRNYEWLDVLKADLDPAKPLLDDGDDKPRAMRGWLNIYTSDNPASPFLKTSARVQLRAAIEAVLAKHKGKEVSVVVAGHSLGAALAVLSAFDLVENGVVPEGTRVAAVVFGCPRVGNKELKERLERHENLKILHTRNEIDMITRYPPVVEYEEMGVNLVIDTMKSPELKMTLNPGDWHNLQGMLHVVAGWNGKQGEFKMAVDRCLALVNKSCGLLKSEYLVPESWWVVQNKGMVFDEATGQWTLAHPDEEDLPVPEF